jgi:uncharacterized membrane protein YfcA
MNKTFKILEIIWLVMGCIGVFMCIYSLVIGDNRGAIYFLAFFIVCGVMYMVRKRQRKNFEKAEKQKEQIK